jgi:hypothetical protein
VSDDEGLFANINPDPAEPQQHPPYKLMDIFDSTRRAYNKAHANFKKSGHHNPRFWDYVNPEVTTNYGFQLGARPTDVMYLYAWIQKRGEFHDSPSCILVCSCFTFAYKLIRALRHVLIAGIDLEAFIEVTLPTGIGFGGINGHHDHPQTSAPASPPPPIDFTSLPLGGSTTSKSPTSVTPTSTASSRESSRIRGRPQGPRSSVGDRQELVNIARSLAGQQASQAVNLVGEAQASASLLHAQRERELFALMKSLREELLQVDPIADADHYDFLRTKISKLRVALSKDEL